MMKYLGQKNGFGVVVDALEAHDLVLDSGFSLLGAGPRDGADLIRANGGPALFRIADLVAPAGDERPANTISVADPRADLNENPGNNDSIGAAQALDRAGLTVTSNPNLYDTSLPSLVIQGSVSPFSDQDFYSITLQAGELLVLDVDGTTGGLDSFLTLYGPGTTKIGDNDDLFDPDAGSGIQFGHNTDSFIHFRASVAGTYYFSIGSFDDPSNPTSGSYQLNVSIGPPASAAQIAAEDTLALNGGESWNHLALSYGIPTLYTQYPDTSWEEINDHDANPSTTDFRAFNASQSSAADQLVQLIANVSGLTFARNTSSPGQADIRYAMSVDSNVDVAYAYLPTNGGPTSKGGSAWFNTTDFNSPVRGNYSWMGILHETGHAVGLKHGHEFPFALSEDHDSTEFSVMTYRSYVGKSLATGYTNETWGYPQTLMMYDIAALQAMYGANFNTNSGNSVYSWNPTTGEMSINGVGQGAPGNGAGGSANRVFMTIWDGGGTDTYDLSSYGGGVTIDLTPGGWSTTSAVQLANLGSGHMARGNVFNALQYNGDPRSLIENAYGGAGNDSITGNAANNRLEGRGGNDQLFGMEGNDAFYFTNDFNALDHVDGGSGNNDQIGLQGNYAGANALTLGANTITGVEAIVVLPGFSYDITTVDANIPAGGVLKIQGTQLPAGQSLTVNGSAETDGALIAYGGQGNDHFIGGAGGDGFYFGPGGFNASDLIDGGAGANDQLALDGNYTITMGGNVSNVEVLVFLPGPTGLPNTFNVTTSEAFVGAGQTMTIFGVQVSTAITFDGSNEHDGAFSIYGGSAADTLTAGSGADWLFGAAGGDTLTGGAGGDIFFYDDVSQSTSTGFDRLIGFDDDVDRIDLPFAVTSFLGSTSGTLDSASMDTTFANEFAGRLTVHQAALFVATGGDLAGQIFAVIDANGVAGYQAGADYVIGFTSPATPIDQIPGIFI